MSVGFIGAGQLAHALVKGFTVAGNIIALHTPTARGAKTLMIWNKIRLFCV